MMTFYAVGQRSVSQRYHSGIQDSSVQNSVPHWDLVVTQCKTFGQSVPTVSVDDAERFNIPVFENICSSAVHHQLSGLAGIEFQRLWTFWGFLWGEHSMFLIRMYLMESHIMLIKSINPPKANLIPLKSLIHVLWVMMSAETWWMVVYSHEAITPCLNIVVTTGFTQQKPHRHKWHGSERIWGS